MSDQDRVSDTEDFKPPAGAAAGFSSQPRVEIDLATLSDRGLVRPNNEDHYLAVRFGRFLHCLQTNLPPQSIPERFEESGYGLLVADGMGGQQAGEVASRLAIAALVELVLSTPDWVLSLENPPDVEVVEWRAAARLQKVSQTLASTSEADWRLHGMGTTLTMAITYGARALVVHVGDSRAYLYRQNRLVRLTRDHNYAQELADAGILSVEEAAQSRLRNVLSRSLGGDERVDADFHRANLEHGDRLLLCSDGLTEGVDDPAIAELLARHPTSREACDALVDRALDSGGRDNITVVLAGYSIGK